MNDRTTAHTNRLAREKSPYLLQHQHNPVDWHAWGEEAFAKARSENKPIFLSIGYSTCHWCHVMERESFENEAVAAFMNEHFVAIKIDREERPDVDRIYMTFIQATSGQGGWPLNVFLTPDLKPFFGGTYWPPDDRHGRPRFLAVLGQVAEVWKDRHADIAHSAQSIHERIVGALANPSPEPASADIAAVLHRAADLFKASYDPTHGGFGGAPKFPQPSVPSFLLRFGRRFGDEEAVRMVLNTCDQMASGGINDQLAGGFSRYAVDEVWLVPHFEKMLYDNAQLANLYLDAWLVSGEQRHATIVRNTLDYVLRDMTHPDGGFFSAEDADSEGHEGKFYCWTLAELNQILTPDEAAVATRYFGVSAGGNFVDHSHPHPLQGQNVLSIADPALDPGEESLLASAREKMMAARQGRVRPHLDDKVLVSWNGLMLGAMARAWAILGAERYRTAAEKNVAFVKRELWDSKSKTLHHRWRDGERDNVQLLESYAFYLPGLLDLYEATLDPDLLEFAIEIAQAMITRFYDSAQGGFWQATGADLIMKMKPDHDGAEPSGNSTAVLALLKLGKITGNETFVAAAEKTLNLNSPRMREQPQALPLMLQGLDFILEEPIRAVLAGDVKSPAGLELLHALHSVYRPEKVVMGSIGPVDEFVRGLEPSATPKVYLCTGSECLPQITDPASIKTALNRPF